MCGNCPVCCGATTSAPKTNMVSRRRRRRGAAGARRRRILPPQKSPSAELSLRVYIMRRQYSAECDCRTDRTVSEPMINIFRFSRQHSSPFGRHARAKRCVNLIFVTLWSRSISQFWRLCRWPRPLILVMPLCDNALIFIPQNACTYFWTTERLSK